MNVAVLIFDGVELIDMSGPIDVFLKANRVIPADQQYNVYTVAPTSDPILTEKGAVKIAPAFSIGNCPKPDLVVIPGCIDNSNNNSIPAPAPIIAFIKKMGELGIKIMSVCVGLLSLAETGLLNGRCATTHYLSIGDVHTKYPLIELVKNVRYVEDESGQFLTTGGITSGIDGALRLVEQHNNTSDNNVADFVADIMIYNRTAPLPPFTLLPPYYFLD